MKTTTNILSKIFFFLILAAGGGSGAWAQTVQPSTLHDAHWYTLRLVRANNSYLSSASAYMDNNGLKIRQTNQGSANSANESFWCFVPNGDGTYCIYNRAMGPDYRLGTTTNQTNPNTRTSFYRVSDAVPSNVQVKFDVFPSTYNSGSTGFSIKPAGTNKFWDDGRGTYLTVWDNSNHSACLGSDGNCFVTMQVENSVLVSAGYKLIINGATDCTVSVGGNTYQNGERIVLDSANPKNLTGFVLNNVGADKFVYGPVLDLTWGTITYTIVDRATTLTEGWYQMQVVTGNGVNSKIAARNTNINTQSPYIYAMAMADEHQDTGNNYWGMKYSGVPAYAGEAATYIYLAPNGAGNTQILLPTGHYVQNNGCASRTAVNVTTRWQNNLLATKQWVESNATGWDEAPAAAASDGYPRDMALRQVDLSQYNVYKVDLDNWTPAANTYQDATVAIKSASMAADYNCGLSKVYHNGYFFFKRGYEPTVEDFEVQGVTFENMTMEIEGTSEIKTLHFKEFKQPWYTIKNTRKNNFITVSANGIEDNEQLKWGVSTATTAGEYWMMEKDGQNGFYLINKAYGPDYVLGMESTTNGARLRMYHRSEAENANTHFDRVETNRGGFSIVQHGHNNIGFHDLNNQFAIWNGNAVNDEGSNFVFTRVEDNVIDACPTYNVYKVDIEGHTGSVTYTGPATDVVGLTTLHHGQYIVLKQSAELTTTHFAVSSISDLEVSTTAGSASAPALLHLTEMPVPPATEGWKAIITQPAGDTNEYRVRTTEDVRTGRHYALNGEYLDLVADPTPTSVTLNTDEDFVWGPFINTEARTITFEVRTTVSAFEAGHWYQLQLRNKDGQWFDGEVRSGNMIDGVNTMANQGIKVRNQGSQIYAMSARRSGYPLEFTGVDPDGEASYSYVYVAAVNGGNVTILSQNGNYVKPGGDGQTAPTTVPLNYNASTNSFRWNSNTGPWALPATASYITIGQTSRFSGNNNIEFIAHPVKTGEDFNIYRVDVAEGLHVKYTGQKPVIVVDGGNFDREAKTATAGQYFFFPKDYTPVARDFTIENSTPTTFNVTSDDFVNHLELNLALKDGVSFRFRDPDGRALQASVFYTDEHGVEHELTTSTTFNFGNRPYSPAYFEAKGSMVIQEMIYNTSSNVITFTLKECPNLLLFSHAPAGGEWDVDTHWFTWRNNRDGQGADKDYRYMTTSTTGVDNNCYLVAQEGRNPMYVNDAGGAWCFVGNNTTGFEIYNKAYGPEFVFAFLGNNNFAMVNKNDKPAGARTTFTYGDNSRVVPAGTDVAYIFKIGTGNPNDHVHVTQGGVINWSAGDGNRLGDTGSSFTITHIEDAVIDALPEYDIYKVTDADVVYNGTSQMFGRRTGKPYLFVDKDSPMTIAEAYGPYASLITGFSVGTLAGSDYIKTITARKADTSQDYYRIVLQGWVPDEYDHMAGDGTWHRAAAGAGSSARRVAYSGDDRESYFSMAAGAEFNGSRIHPQDASNANIDYRSINILAEDNGLFKRTYAIVFPGLIVHRPSAYLQKAIAENYTSETGYNIDKDTDPYLEVKLKDGSTVKLQNTPVFEITHFLKPGEQRDIWMSTTSSSASGESKLRTYMNWYDYDTERLPDFNVFNFKVSAKNTSTLESTAKVFANGYVMGENSAHGANYTQRFVRVTMPQHTAAQKDDYSYNLAGDLSRWTDHKYNWANGDAGATVASFTDPNGRASGGENFLEPTIGLRQIFHVRSAYEMADQLTNCTGDKWLEKETITFPSRGNNWADWKSRISMNDSGNNFYNVVPLNYVYKDYWVYSGGNLVRVGDAGVTIVAEVDDDEETGISIKTSYANGYLANSVGVYAEKNSEECRDASRFIQFAYPTGGLIPNMQDVSRRKATINVYLKVGETKYNIKQFTLVFQNDTEPLPYYEILEHPELNRSDEYLRTYTGKVHARMHFDTSYLRAYDPSDNSSVTEAANYYQYPLEFSQTAYGYYNPDAKWVEWSEYGLRIHGGTATSWKNNAGLGNSNPNYEGTTYLRALYDYKALQNQAASSNARLQEARDTYENADNGDIYIERKARAYAEAQQRVAARAGELDAARANLQTAYDRSYCFYADVSEQPGQIARIVVPDRLCMGTQIFCTAWVGTATAVNQGSPYPASVIFRFRGVKVVDGKEELTTIYSYCPGQISNIAVDSNRQLVAGRTEQTPSGGTYAQAIWQQVYFTFTNTYSNDYFDHFVLEIDNNSKGSSGSDLYFDDVRLYTQKPVVKVENAAPVCSHEMNVVRIATDYDSFITAVEGQVPAAEDAKRDYVGIYSFLDSKIYHETLEATKDFTHPNGDYAAAFDAALIGDRDYNNCVVGGQFFPELYAFHNIKFHNHYMDHAPILYHQLATNQRLETACRMDYTDDNGNITSRKLVFNCSMVDDRLKSADYLIVFQQVEQQGKTPQQLINEITNPAKFYNLDGSCAIVDTLHAVLATRAEIDFDNDLDPSSLNFCEGTNPSISLTGYSYDYNGKVQAVKDQYYDWYYGTLAEFENEAVYVGDEEDDRDSQWHLDELVGKEDFCMYHLLLNFRHFYPDAGEVQVNDGTVTARPWDQDPVSGEEFEFTEHMLHKLKQWTTPEPNTGLQKLYLHKISVVLPSSSELQTVLAVQMGEQYRYEDDDVEHQRPIIYCMEPVEIKYRTSLKAPVSHVGMADVDYSETPYHNHDEDNTYSLPVRLTAAMVEAMTQGKELRIPLRNIRPSGFYRKPDATNADVRFIRNDQHYDIVVEQSNDPQWQKFVTAEEGPVQPIVGQILGIEAQFSRLKGLRQMFREWLGIKKPAEDDYTEYIRINFKPDFPASADPAHPLYRKFEPREGYYYILSVPYLEQLVEGELLDPSHKITDDNGNTLSKPCEGSLLIPLKIVPDYAVWTGTVNSDWNNDRNWRRADYRELVPSEHQNPASDPFATYRSNTENGDKGSAVMEGNFNGIPQHNVAAGTPLEERDIYMPSEIYESADNAYTYAPMYSTSVIVPAEGITHFPVLVDHEETAEGLLDIANGKDDTATPATPWIRYDMVATDHDGSQGYYSVVKYYENHIKDVTFLPASRMYGSEHLTYKQAWVEYELAADRWYTLSSPLQNTYSGDWYSPTASADEAGRQLTPHFNGITYSTELNDRFRPAYYQRSWDKGTTNVYQCMSSTHGSGFFVDNNPYNTAVKLDWSKVYNDVTVNYSNGGFSVRPVLPDNAAGNVLVRMPKEDVTYDYYDPGNVHGGTTTAMARNAGHHRLFTEKLKNAEQFSQNVQNVNASPYYLVGNPFMAPMDMDQFFAANPQFEAGKFWILADDKQDVNIKNLASGDWLSTSVDANGTVAPLQAFFVKKTTATKGQVAVKYTSAMEAAVSKGSAPLKAPRQRSVATDGTFMISNGESTALCLFSEEADNGFCSEEDAELLLDSNLSDHVATVFTAALNADGEAQAMQANVMSTTVTTLPIGVIAPTDPAEGTSEDYETTLIFTGTDALAAAMAVDVKGENADPYLYDAVLGTHTPISEGMTLTVKGSSAGRYFIVSGMHLPYDNGDDIDNADGESLDTYNLHGIRVATPQHGNVTIRGSRKEFRR